MIGLEKIYCDVRPMARDRQAVRQSMTGQRAIHLSVVLAEKLDKHVDVKARYCQGKHREASEPGSSYLRRKSSIPSIRSCCWLADKLAQ